MTVDRPEDIRPKWFSVIRRLQSVAKSDGFSILRISILVDSNGDPLGWIEPTKYRIEPKSGITALLSLFDRGTNS